MRSQNSDVFKMASSAPPLSLMSLLSLVSLTMLAPLPSLVGSSIVEAPRDTAALVDARDVRLNCSVSPGVSFKWESLVEWHLLSVDLYNSGTGPVQNPNYTVAQDGSSLTINSLKQDLAAMYVCKTGQEYAAARVATMAPLSCSILGEVHNVIAGELVSFNCSTSYHSWVKSPSKPLTPTLTLVKSDGTVLARQKAEKPGLFFLIANQSATADMDGTQLNCRLNFEDEDPNNLRSMRVLPPVYEDSCAYNLIVQYGVTWAEIVTHANDTASNVAYVGQTLTCSANGRPRPSFAWEDNNGTIISREENLTLTRQMVSQEPVTFTCVATNSVDGGLGTQPAMSNARASVRLIVSEPRVAEGEQRLAPWAIALVVFIPLLVLVLLAILVIFLCLRRRNRNKPYKPPPTKKKHDPTVKSLIYNPTPQAPGTGTGLPQTFSAYQGSQYPGQGARSPPPRTEYSNSPFGRPDAYGSDDFGGSQRNVNMNASVGHGDLGMSGLSGSRGADMNAGSRVNLQEGEGEFDGRGKRGYPLGGGRGAAGGSLSEGLNSPPLPPRQPETAGRYYNNNNNSSNDHHQGQRRGGRGGEGRQNHVRSPPPPASYLDPGFGRQPSITSTSTNRSTSSEAGRVTGRSVEKNPAGRHQKEHGRGDTTRTNPLHQGQAERVKKAGKKPTNAVGRQTDACDANSLQGSEV